MLAVTFGPWARLLGVGGETEIRRRTWRSAWPWLVLGSSLTLFAFAGRGGDPLSADTLAPALEVSSTAGHFDLSAQRGHVVVLAFWATWCPACREEGPSLSRVHEQLRGRGDRVLGVAIDAASLAALGRESERFGMSYPVAEASREVFDRFRVTRLPTVYVIGPRGRVTASFVGSTTASRILAAVEAARIGRDGRNASCGEPTSIRRGVSLEPIVLYRHDS